ncbi:hypothetical protein L2K20_24610 [Mycobacterium sp. MBM]|nr:hypothetical protein [Mycobacterium sp. MBM]
MYQNLPTERARAVTLSVTAIAAMTIAYLLMFTVLRDPNVTDKLMNGVAPPGTDVTGNRTAVIAGILAALGGWTAAIASRRGDTNPADAAGLDATRADDPFHAGAGIRRLRSRDPTLIRTPKTHGAQARHCRDATASAPSMYATLPPRPA